MSGAKIFQYINFNFVDCGYYYEDNLVTALPSGGNLATWKNIGSIPPEEVSELAWIMAAGMKIEDLELKCLGEYNFLRESISSHIRSLYMAKVDLEHNSILDFIPDKLICDFYRMKNHATKEIIETTLKPKNYKFLCNASMLLEEISRYNVNIDFSAVTKNVPRIKQHKFKNSQVKYNLFGTKTGRLSMHRDSFPILTLPKAYRQFVLPKNDLFVELDYNGAEARTLLALSGADPYDGDIHEWNRAVAARNLTTREEVKQRFFAWLYNPAANDYGFEQNYDKNVYKEYFDGHRVSSPLGREIESDDAHALNYLIQSTTSDLVLGKAVEISKLLKGRESRVAFIIHDSLILDFNTSDLKLLPEIKKCMKSTIFGKYSINISMGLDLSTSQKEAKAV